MISQGASEINLTFVIEEEDVPRRDPAAAHDVFLRSWIRKYLLRLKSLTAERRLSRC